MIYVFSMKENFCMTNWINILTVSVMVMIILPLRCNADILPQNYQFLFDMCTNKRYIKNPYTHKNILVSCGHCEACQQEKALSRTNRIRNEYDSDKVVLFGTLTYSRFACPYVYVKDIRSCVDGSLLNVYRDSSYRKNRKVDGFTQTLGRVCLAQVPVIDSYGNDYYFKTLRKNRGKVGVCLMSDWQKFAKRLRIYASRYYGIKYRLKLFECSEYGEVSQRPHFHFLLHVPYSDVEKVKSCVLASWPFADRSRTECNIQIARDAASYVSSYVNCGSAFPRFLRKNFRPKHSFSKLYGHGKECFSLPKILQKADTGYLTYTVAHSTGGCLSIADMPIPKYIINRYFPLFKGYSRIAPAEVCNYIYRVSELKRVSESVVDYAPYRTVKSIEYTDEDIHKIGVRLHHAFLDYNRITGRSRFQYAQDFLKVWKAYKMTTLRMFYENKDDVNWLYRYDNIAMYYLNKISSPTLDSFYGKLIFDYNALPETVNKSNTLVSSYYSYLKTKKVNNDVYSRLYDDI